jgi:hypothetical protein
MDKIEGWLLNVFLGKLVARAALIIAAYVAGPVVQNLAVKAGVSVSVDPAKLQVELMLLANAAFEWFKARRMANPNSPAVQTDAKKPGADVSAVAAAIAIP